MEKPDADTVRRFDALMPADPRAQRGKMFGHACAFTGGNMFFGTFAQTLIARVGEERAAALSGGAFRIFEPMAGKAWKEYVQWDPCELGPEEVAPIVVEALNFTAAMPPKKEKASKKRG